MDIKKNLTNIVVLIGLIGSIGAGFTKYGELTTRLDAVSNQTAPDLSKIEENIQTNGLGVSDNRDFKENNKAFGITNKRD